MRAGLGAAAIAVLVGVTGCGSSQGGPSAAGDPAVWDVAPHQDLSAHSTAFTAVVSRASCSSGVQGTPEAPVVHAGASTITITFRISPHIAGGSCQGSDGVGYRVRLGEPIGSRTLVDGACTPGSATVDTSTAMCSEHGVRLAWQGRQARLYPAQP